MKNFLKGSLFALIAGMAASQASAADIAYAQPAPAPSLIGSDPIRTDEFSGFFVGGQVGASFNDVKNPRLTRSQSVFVNGPFGTVPAGGFVASLPSRYKENSAFTVNGIVGYDVNFGGIVIGAALTGGYNGSKNRFDTVFDNTAAQSLGFAGSSIVSGSYDSTYNAGFRLRAGYVVLPQLLAYGFVGMGVESGKYKFNEIGGGVSRDVTVPTWTVGAGVEYALGGGWGVTAEYGYTKGMSQTVSYPYSFNQALPVPGFTGTSIGLASMKAETESHTVKAGVNYRFR